LFSIKLTLETDVEDDNRILVKQRKVEEEGKIIK